jgi:hypothetical protein
MDRRFSDGPESESVAFETTLASVHQVVALRRRQRGRVVGSKSSKALVLIPDEVRSSVHRPEVDTIRSVS